MDGTDKSLKATLDALNTFYNMSGLKINVEKNATWIGSLSNSRTRLCSNINLDRTQRPFKVLGVIFSTEVYIIWELNYHGVLNQVENLLRQWAKRKLTLFGRIKIIKSLAISKFVRLLISLPNSPGEL